MYVCVHVSPDSEHDLKQGADPRDKEDGADEMALGQAIVL